MLAPYLGSTSDHIREEVLHLMIASFLNGNNNFDYFTVVDSIAKLLDDQKANVRFAATEALSTLVFKGDKNKIWEILYEIVERREYNRLWDRFDAGKYINNKVTVLHLMIKFRLLTWVYWRWSGF